MATIAFPSLSKCHTLSTSHTYTYVHHPASQSHPTLLFLHGFPSSCFDWRHQIHFFANKGYGILAPDLLGYGGTSKPTSLDAYRSRPMASEIIELMDHEGIARVHAVAHDTGCNLLSRLADYFPGERFDLQMVNSLTREFMGFERFGYLEFFVQSDAGRVLDESGDSFFTLFYPADPDLWITDLGPIGALKSWLLNDRRGPLPTYISEKEKTTHQTIMKGQYSHALKWYQALVGNINEEDEIRAGLRPVLPMPVLMVSPQPSRLQFPGTMEKMNQVAGDLTMKTVSTKGHWVQLEAGDEVNAFLTEFWEQANA
ncbi:hypothetical protein EYZ11_006793 [Aspergillus tanneri]|uniref:AB hydrolase-1 domain-containing protein n=1 Tax=Aspergillus tanneri TaxID=1220188 RepID=A0A4S3JGT8_9EURO|nr:hypothetical protein EYZ11_006793 [Aspergillus tanneri]